jgi:hypothetical protein
MTPSQWLEEYLHGRPGSDQRAAYQLAAELAPERGLYASIDKFSEIVEKLKARDSAFFYKIDRQLLPKRLTNRTAAKHIYRIALSFVNTDLAGC